MSSSQRKKEAEESKDVYDGSRNVPSSEDGHHEPKTVGGLQKLEKQGNSSPLEPQKGLKPFAGVFCTPQ